LNGPKATNFFISEERPLWSREFREKKESGRTVLFKKLQQKNSSPQKKTAWPTCLPSKGKSDPKAEEGGKAPPFGKKGNFEEMIRSMLRGLFSDLGEKSRGKARVYRRKRGSVRPGGGLNDAKRRLFKS